MTHLPYNLITYGRSVHSVVPRHLETGLTVQCSDTGQQWSALTTSQLF